jgi:(1->4)-alpha-D-glucan 1-alpha-D-glucosylmutase
MNPDIPRATYRLQFHAGFTFLQAEGLAGYLRDLGISHVYASPILTARDGSMHGYDVISYDAINPALGGEDKFCQMAATLRQHGIGIILDIVPNHMAVGGADNKMWLDVLRLGQKSPYAAWFDIDFGCNDPDLAGKIHAPFLGKPLREALDNRELRLVSQDNGGGYIVMSGEHGFPIRPEDEKAIARDGIETFVDPSRMAMLLAKQNYVLDAWWNAGDRINWRRFFDITQLAAIRMDHAEAYEAKHALVFRLYRDGIIDGLRIDHIDGLADPAGYCRMLRRDLERLQPLRPPSASSGRAWLLVEKILASDERLPSNWSTDGTTGYDFMDQVSAVLHDADGGDVLADHWASISHRSRDFEAEEYAARREILDRAFDGQRERLVRELQMAARSTGLALTAAALRRALTDIIVEMRAYRGYQTGDEPDQNLDDVIAVAIDRALRRPTSERAAILHIRAVFSAATDVSRQARQSCLRQFHHLTAPLAAKAVEDTAFYRYGRLLSRNDVGFDAGRTGADPAVFHDWMQRRAEDVPHAMLATATHDHKRGEDVRARLAVLSEWPTEWVGQASSWAKLNGPLRPDDLHPGDEYMFYQTAVGTCPPDLVAEDHAGLTSFAERLAAWWIKALREAKLRSSWAAPDERYEDMAIAFATAALDPVRNPEFISAFLGFVSRLARPAAANGLVQTALRCLAPGVPDTYQGS